MKIDNLQDVVDFMLKNKIRVLRTLDGEVELHDSAFVKPEVFVPSHTETPEEVAEREKAAKKDADELLHWSVS